MEEKNLIMSVTFIPDVNRELLEQEELEINHYNIVNIGTNIINNRIFITYNNGDSVKIYSCFIFLAVANELVVNDYFLMNNQCKKVASIIDNKIEYVDMFGENSVSYIVERNKCRKIVGSTHYQIKKELPIRIDTSFIKLILDNYKKTKKIPIKCKVKQWYTKVSSKTYLVYVQERNDESYTKLFKNILNSMRLVNSETSYEKIIKIWRNRMEKKVRNDYELNKLYNHLETQFLRIYEEKI